jgi:hypothetical protein
MSARAQPASRQPLLDRLQPRSLIDPCSVHDIESFAGVLSALRSNIRQEQNNVNLQEQQQQAFLLLVASPMKFIAQV